MDDKSKNEVFRYIAEERELVTKLQHKVQRSFRDASHISMVIAGARATLNHIAQKVRDSRG